MYADYNADHEQSAPRGRDEQTELAQARNWFKYEAIQDHAFVSRCFQSNQSDHTTAYDLDSELVKLRYLRIGSETWEPVLQAIRNAQQKAQVAA